MIACYNVHMEKIHDKKRLVINLLDWYDEHARVLPWREEATPYRVWVSEIMLQQTRVEAVKPYFERFLKAFPSISSLANAKDDELSKVWEGLGHYNRVKNMKKCAQMCMELYDGKLPSTYEQLLQLPGIGSYTAGAVASIAFKEKAAAVDGNVLRVFSRLLVSEDDILKESTKKKFQKIILDYIPEERCDAFNQALMEIGALVCVPNAAPRCNICPLAQDCIGYQSGKAHFLPIKKAKKQRRIEKRTILVVVWKDKVLLYQRPEKGLLSKMYEFKNLEDHYLKKDIINRIGAKHVLTYKKLKDAKHVFSHIEWHMKACLIEVDEPIEEGVWCTKEELEHTYAIPSAFQTYKESLYEWWKEKSYE